MRMSITWTQEHLLTVLQCMTEDEQNDAYENSPPPSQPRTPACNTNENNPPDQKQPENRELKRKYVDHQSMEANIAKTEDSIFKLERQNHCNTQLRRILCPIVLSKKKSRILSKLPKRPLLTPSHASINEGLTALETNLTLGLHFHLEELLIQIGRVVLSCNWCQTL